MVCLHTWFKFLVFRPGVDCTLTVFFKGCLFSPHILCEWNATKPDSGQTHTTRQTGQQVIKMNVPRVCVCVFQSSDVRKQQNYQVVNLKPNWADNKQILQYLCLVFNPFINVEYDVSVKQFTATLVNHRPDVCVLEPLTQTHWFKSTRLHRPCTNIKEVHVHTDGLLTVRSLHRWHPQTYLSTS